MNQIDKVRREFAQQAEQFNAYQHTQAKVMESERVADALMLSGSEQALEVAAGTGSFGRMIAPRVKTLTELDATAEMLAAGRRESERLGLDNMIFTEGLAEALPFAEASFDIIVCRLAFHHFSDCAPVLREMRRVLRPSGRIALIDVISQDLNARTQTDHIEQLRDPSHTQFLSKTELLRLISEAGLRPTWQHEADIPLRMESWLSLTRTSDEARRTISTLIDSELQGGRPTGLRPVRTEDGILLTHHWIELIIQPIR